MTKKTESQRAILDALAGRLIVSCQAYPGEPLRTPTAMAQMAASAMTGGAAGIRAQGLDDIRLIDKTVHAPLIGLVKVGTHGVFITPTLADALAVISAGADIVALDGTRRPRPDGRSLAETIREIHSQTNALVMADVGSLDDALAAESAGTDLIGTTLAGYTGERDATVGPDYDLLSQIVVRTGVPVIAEGRVHTPDQARHALKLGAFAVVVGTAITHPSSITSWFVDALGGATP